MVITIMLILPHSLDKLFGPIWPLPRWAAHNDPSSNQLLWPRLA
jgi:hypothetical protein